MATITFDTHKYILKLEQAGFTQQQAEAQAEALMDILGSSATDIVTQSYLDYRLKAELSELKVDLIKWMAGALIAQAGVITALVKLL
jgi:hypothetical protein